MSSGYTLIDCPDGNVKDRVVETTSVNSTVFTALEYRLPSTPNTYVSVTNEINWYGVVSSVGTAVGCASWNGTAVGCSIGAPVGLLGFISVYGPRVPIVMD